MDPDISKWPLVYQIVALAGAALTGTLMWVRGSRSPAAPPSAADELARIRDERQQDRDRQVSKQIENLRHDTEMAIKAIKESIDTRFNDLSDEQREMQKQIGETEKSVAVLEALQKRTRR